MKKNVLFIIPSLDAGGGEKSLINLLSQMDFDLFDIDLFLFKHDGLFMEFLPKQVNVLPLPKTYRIFTLPLFQALLKFLFTGQFSLAFNRFIFSLKNRMMNDTSKREQANWKYMMHSMEKLEKKYDVAIAFLEKTSTYFCIDKVDSSKKIGWVHIDYDKLGMDPKMDIHYFEQLQHIVTVSEECSSILKRRFPSQKNKVDVIYNVISPMLIHQMADQGKKDLYIRTNGDIVLLSIGRLHHQKGFEMAIEACKKLLDKNFKVKWFIIGEGNEREKLRTLIQQKGVKDNFKLLGLKANPYPYIKQADIYVQTSRFEGKSIAIDEAKILNKPIVVTDFSTARDQIRNEIDGLIVGMNPEAIAEGIERLMKDSELRERLVSNLAKLKLGTEEEVNKLYKLLG